MKGYTVKEIYVGEFALLDNQENLDRFLEQLMIEGFKIDIGDWLRYVYSRKEIESFVVILDKSKEYKLSLRFFDKKDLELSNTRCRLKKVMQLPKDTMRLYLVAAGYEC
jgi:hypothetical protein